MTDTLDRALRDARLALAKEWSVKAVEALVDAKVRAILAEPPTQWKIPSPDELWKPVVTMCSPEPATMGDHHVAELVRKLNKVEDALNAANHERAEARSILGGPDTGGLPHDYSLANMCHSRMNDIAKLRERLARTEHERDEATPEPEQVS